MAKSAAWTFGSTVGREIVRGVLGCGSMGAAALTVRVATTAFVVTRKVSRTLDPRQKGTRADAARPSDAQDRYRLSGKYAPRIRLSFSNH